MVITLHEQMERKQQQNTPSSLPKRQSNERYRGQLGRRIRSRRMGQKRELWRSYRTISKNNRRMMKQPKKPNAAKGRRKQRKVVEYCTTRPKNAIENAENQQKVARKQLKATECSREQMRAEEYSRM
jgi:hypothetical protein